MKERKTISNWLNNRYILIIRNEEDFADKRQFNFTYAKAVVLGFFMFFLILGLSIFLVNTILSRWFDPRYAQLQTQRKIILLSAKVDSLEIQNNLKDHYIRTFKTMLTGEFESDSSVKEQNSPVSNVDIDKIAPVDSQFRKQFEGNEYDLTWTGTSTQPNLQAFLFKPIEGIVTQEFSPDDNHYAVDIVAQKDEPVKSVASGTVILATWTDDTGYVIGIQHEGGLVSFYKHNAVLFKKMGDFVQAGDIIAIIGNSGDLTSGTHLHFELWHNGKPINPKNYISL